MGLESVSNFEKRQLMGPAERINITEPRVALRRIDAAAARVGMNRSQYLVNAALAASEGNARAQL